jgi:hypothetical protein
MLTLKVRDSSTTQIVFLPTRGLLLRPVKHSNLKAPRGFEVQTIHRIDILSVGPSQGGGSVMRDVPRNTVSSYNLLLQFDYIAIGVLVFPTG